jgi:putative salt-induced outer membrane protein YdiY
MNLSLRYLLTLFIFVASFSQADTLWLNNGDKLSGSMIAINDQALVWQHDILGELLVELGDVRGVDSDTLFDVAEKNSPRLYGCRFFMLNNTQLLDCGQYKLSLVEFADVSGALAAAADGPPPPVAMSHEGFISASVEKSSGNTTELDINISFEERLRFIDTRHTIDGEYRLETVDETDRQQRRSLGYKYDQFLTPQWYFTANGNVSDDEFKDIESRYAGGAGFGYQFLETEFVELSMEVGVNYVSEEYIVASDEDRSRPAMRWATDYRWYVEGRGNGLEFFYNHEYLPSLTDAADWEFAANAGISYPITGKISASLSLSYDFDGEPPETKEAQDAVWLLGLDYNW